jgi:hypothetical protein
LDDPDHRGLNLSDFNLSKMSTPKEFAYLFGYVFNTWTSLAFCPECIDAAGYGYLPANRESQYSTVLSDHVVSDEVFALRVGWLVLYFVCCALLLIAGITSTLLESMTVAPDILGYVSTVARNSKYLHLPKTNSAMNGGERLRKMGGVEVMMQDVKGNANVGRIALGMKHEEAKRLRPDRLYR